MGRLINGANGPFIGKVGAIIGYTVNGVGYIKGLYKKRTKAPTERKLLTAKSLLTHKSGSNLLRLMSG
jgi:hypothetical protein